MVLHYVLQSFSALVALGLDLIIYPGCDCSTVQFKEKPVEEKNYTTAFFLQKKNLFVFFYFQRQDLLRQD